MRGAHRPGRRAALGSPRWGVVSVRGARYGRRHRCRRRCGDRGGRARGCCDRSRRRDRRGRHGRHCDRSGRGYGRRHRDRSGGGRGDRRRRSTRRRRSGDNDSFDLLLLLLSHRVTCRARRLGFLRCGDSRLGCHERALSSHQAKVGETVDRAAERDEQRLAKAGEEYFRLRPFVVIGLDRRLPGGFGGLDRLERVETRFEQRDQIRRLVGRA